MKVVIVEDEHLTAERIRTLLGKIDPGIEVMATLDSVRSAVAWFGVNENPDLVLMDIQLADGVSFDIFEQVKIENPVIFITAYQEYAIRAFKVNSVDYLLKPVTEEALGAAIEKYTHFFMHKESPPVVSLELLSTIRQMIRKPYKTRFMVRVGDRIKSLEVDQILYFYSFQKGTYLHTEDNRNYVVEFTLETLMDMLDPALFFRINRRYLISHRAIGGMIALSGNKLKIELLHHGDDDIYISRDRLSGFKEWLDR
jgi:DNA-binding LytR/AlgR family response regulator